MKLERKKNRIPILIPMASMGDIAFLLIIFFLLTSNFIKEGHVKIEQAASPDIEELEESSVSVTVDEAGQVWLQGTLCPLDLLKSGVEALLDGAEKRVVMLKVDRDVPQENFGEVILELSKAGAELALVGTEE
jgi:biopolymer transport protein ExbD